MNSAIRLIPAALSWRRLRMHIAPAMAGVGAASHVALTFDDGPDATSTPAFLAKLAALNVRATFFMLGSQVRRSSSLACEVAAAGHEIALHGYQHHLHLRRTPGSIRDDMRRGYDLIGEMVGVVPRWWRPPYGVLTHTGLRVSGQLGLQPVLWTTWGQDWTAHATPKSVLDTVRRNLHGGATVLLHDSDITASPGCWRSSLGMLEDLMDLCRNRGWSVGTLADHEIVR